MSDKPSGLTNQQTMLIELNVNVKYLTEAFQELKKLLSDGLAQKLDRTEYNRMQAEDRLVQTDHEQRLRKMEKEADQIIGRREVVTMVCSTTLSLAIGILVALIEAHKL